MIRPATLSDIRDFYGRTLPVTARVLAFERDGKVVSISGYAIQHGVAFAFSDDDGTLSKREIAKMGRKTAEMLKAFGGPVYAIEGPGGDVSLKHFGFTKCCEGVWRL